MERAEWTEQRIGDQFRLLWERVGALDRTNERLAVMEGDLKRLMKMDLASTEDVRECRDGIKVLADAFQKRAEAREAERKERELERKKDRRWQVWAVFTAAGLVIAALALLIPLLSGPA